MRPLWLGRLMHRKLLTGIAAALPLLLASLAAGNSPQRHIAICLRSTLGPGCSNRVEFKPGGAVVPKKLPAHEFAPVGQKIHGTIAMEGGGHPLALREVVIHGDEDVAVDANGLHACHRHLLESHGVAAARRLCRAAIVGSGMAHVGLASSETILKAPLTLFNGGTSNGETRLFVHSAIGAPNPMPVVSSVKIQGKYSGLHSIWRIPRILGGDGSLLDFKFKLERRFVSKGTEHSYLSAKCPDEVLRMNAATALFRNDARVPGMENAMSLKGRFAIPCSSAP
jgi:hypothetical protein